MSDTSETLPSSSAMTIAPLDFHASPATLAGRARQAASVIPSGGGFTVLAPAGHWAVIDARGPEARSFLHNQLTNDVTHLGARQAALAAFCSPKGRMLASLLYWPLTAPVPQEAAAASAAPSAAPHAVPSPTHHDDLAHWPDIRLLVSADIAETIRKRLHMFVLRTKVKLSDHSNDVALIGLSAAKGDAAFDSGLTGLLLAMGVCDAAGDPSGAPVVHAGSSPLSVALGDMVQDGSGKPAAAFPLLRHDSTDGESVTLVRLADAAGQRRFLLCVPAGARAAWLAALETRCRAVDVAHWDWLAIQAAEPQITAPTQDAFVPQMINFEAIGGVNFRKGCYPGQEVVARSQYRGTVKRRATLAHAAQARAGDEIIDLNDPANQGDPAQWQPCGRVVNAAAAPDGGMDCLIELKLATPADAALRVVLQPAASDAAPASQDVTPPATAPLTVYGLPYALPTE